MRRLYGSNSLVGKRRQSFLSKFAESFRDPIIRILLGALVLNAILMLRGGNLLETAGIAAAVLISTLVSTISEYGSEKAFEKLQSHMGGAVCSVKRAGSIVTLSAAELVRGDIVLLRAGEVIPADGVLISGALTLDQSPLNGESREAKKLACADIRAAYGSDVSSLAVCTAAALSDCHRVLRGSPITSGSGEMAVSAVGGDTLYGSLAHELTDEVRESPLKKRLSVLAGKLSTLGYAAAALVIIADLVNLIILKQGFHTMAPAELFADILHALTLGITVVVVAVPEGLPMMITVVLSSNMLRMTRDNVMVRRLVGIETAGSMNILFTDKTGTITLGKLCAVSITDGAGKRFHSPRALPDGRARLLCRMACLSDNSNATDRALSEFSEEKRGDLKPHKLSSLPFTSERKYSAAAYIGPDGAPVTLFRGAPEYILAHCSSYTDAKGEHMLDKTLISEKLSALANRAFRVIALAYTDGERTGGPLPYKMSFLGLVAVRDELRREAKNAVSDLRGAGIQCVMITGDNPDTAAAIARECGILSAGEEEGVITSAELGAMDDERLASMLTHLRVVARAAPSDKSRLVRVSERMGLVCGMTGDGINDAPALRLADVGFALGSGTEVAREAGDIVILDDNLTSVTNAVLYGRTIFESIRKFIVFQLTMNLCAVGISVIGPFIGYETPISVIQMLWVNMIMDTLAGLAFAGEAPVRRCLTEPPKRREEHILTSKMAGQILFTGLFTIAICAAFLINPPIVGRVWENAGEGIVRTGFFALFVFCGVAGAFTARAPRLNVFAGLLKNQMFILIMLCVCIVQTAIVELGGAIFRCEPIGIYELFCILRVALCVPAAELLRRLLLRLFAAK